MLAPRLLVLGLAALLALPVLALTLGPASVPLLGETSERPNGPSGGEGAEGDGNPLEGFEGMLQQRVQLGPSGEAGDVPPLAEALGLQALTFAPREAVDPGRTGAEPGLDVHSNGCVYIHAIAGRNLWRKCPGDDAFLRLSPPGFVIQGLDAEVAIDPGTGHVFYSDLWLGSASMTASRNGGVTWTTNNPLGLLPPIDDRQWLLPLGNDEVLHIANQIPAGLGVTRCLLPPVGNVVACAPQGFAETFPTRFCICPPGQPAASRDGQTIILPYFNINNVDPDAVPPLQGGTTIEAAISRNRGLTWDTVTVAKDAVETAIFPVAAIDDAGNAFVVWAAKRGSGQDWEVWMARSFDAGAHWDPTTYKVSTGGTNVLPWIDAGAPGHIAVAWYHSDAQTHPESVQGLWYVDFAQSFDAADPNAAPTVQRTRAAPEPLHSGPLSVSGLGGNADRDLLDFFQVDLDAMGHAHIAYADDHTDGHDGHAHVYYARQTS